MPPVVVLVAAAASRAPPDERVLLLRSQPAMTLAAGIAFLAGEVHSAGDEELVVRRQLGVTEQGNSLVAVNMLKASTKVPCMPRRCGCRHGSCACVKFLMNPLESM
jgi:hypothetical protein